MTGKTDDDRLILWRVVYQVGNYQRAVFVSTKTKLMLREAFDESHRIGSAPHFVIFLDASGAKREMPRRCYLYAEETTPASRERAAQIESALTANDRIQGMIDGND